MSRTPFASLLALAGLLAPLAPALPQAQPFAPGERWAHDAEALRPWIPTSLGFAGEGALAWAAGGYGTPHLQLHPAASHDGPAAEETGVGAAFPVLEVAAGRGMDALFALAQYPAPDAWTRRTEVTAWAPPAIPGGPPAPRWAHDLGLSGNGPALLDCDAAGDAVVAATFDSAGGRVRLDRLRAADGSLVHRADVPALALGGLVISADGSRTVLATGLTVRVFGSSGETLFHQDMPGAIGALAVGGDGERVAVGYGNEVRVLRASGAAYVEVGRLRGAAGEIAVSLAVAPVTGWIAVGWWRSTTGVDLRVETYDANLARRTELDRRGTAGGLQDLPGRLCFSADGRRLAVGTWGNGSAAPELLLLDVESDVVVLAADLPGSVTALALDPGGTRLLVGYKHTHANQVASTGGIRLYETGESELALVLAPRVGGTLELAFQRPDALSAAFLLGTRVAEPVSVLGIENDLLVDRGRRFWMHPRPVDPSGRADLRIDLPDHPGIFGLELTAQVLWRRADGALVLTPEALPFVIL